MSLVINHNLMSMNASRNLNAAYGSLSTSTERLSSGLRVNTAADDAAGLAIRELMPQLPDAEESAALHITVSIGVAQLGPGQTVSDMMLAADQAMYAAKTQGRNRVVGHSSLGPYRPT